MKWAFAFAKRFERKAIATGKVPPLESCTLEDIKRMRDEAKSTGDDDLMWWAVTRYSQIMNATTLPNDHLKKLVEEL